MTVPGGQSAPTIGAEPGDIAEDGEIAAFYDKHRKAVRRFLVFGCGCPEQDADDVIQDTILVIRSRYWLTVRALDKPEAYWFKAAERRFRKLRGRQAGRVADMDPVQHLVNVAYPGDQFAAVDRRELVASLVRRLPPRQRQVLWLREAEDLSEAATADVLGISGGSVKRHLHEARKRLGELLRGDVGAWEGEIED